MKDKNLSFISLKKGKYMYCVKCGVKLQDDALKCPLCGTSVWHPETEEKDKTAEYSARYPIKAANERIPAAIFITIVLAAICAVCFIFCMKTFESAAWSGYVMASVANFYCCTILPMWFKRPNPVIFVPIGFISVCGLLLFINIYSGGHWFLSFAFPVTMICALLSTCAISLFRYVGKKKMFITGGLLIAIGGASMLVEFFEHITFDTEMFSWSLYSVSAFFACGMFLILAGIIPPLRDWLHRIFFL